VEPDRAAVCRAISTSERLEPDCLYADRAVRTPTWVADGAVLIGDAAHAMNPHASQGRMQAMVDAMALSDLLPGCLAIRTIPRQAERV